MPADVIVRRATVLDARVLGRHRAEMFRDMGRLSEASYVAVRDAAADFFAEAIAAGSYVGWLAAAAGEPREIVAGAGVQLRPHLPGPSPDGERLRHPTQGLVINVFTERAWRRRGLARRMMEEVVAWARTGVVGSLVLHASDEGRALYEQLGFVATNEMRYAGELSPPAAGAGTA